MQQKMACQDEEDADAELDDQLAEYDALLIEGAGDVLPAVAKAIGGEAFAPYLVALLPDLLKMLKPSSPTADKSFAVGTLAESISAIGATASAFVQSLYPIFMNMSKDEDDEVRSNAIYGLGVLVQNGGEAMIQNYAEIMKILHEVMSKEKDGRVLDNVCAALCRMVMTSPADVVIDEVIPAVIKNLPLKEDQEENKTIFGCLCQMYWNNNDVVIKHIPQILNAVSHTLGEKEIDSDVRLLLINLVKDVHQKYPNEYQLACTLPGINSLRLQKCIEHTN